MGSKRDAGKFDCYANAEDDEPMFILLGRDKHAPALVRMWAELRKMDGEDPEKIREARGCAEWMEQFRRVREHLKTVKAAMAATE